MSNWPTPPTVTEFKEYRSVAVTIREKGDIWKRDEDPRVIKCFHFAITSAMDQGKEWTW